MSPSQDRSSIIAKSSEPIGKGRSSTAQFKQNIDSSTWNGRGSELEQIAEQRESEFSFKPNDNSKQSVLQSSDDFRQTSLLKQSITSQRSSSDRSKSVLESSDDPRQSSLRPSITTQGASSDRVKSILESSDDLRQSSILKPSIPTQRLSSDDAKFVLQSSDSISRSRQSGIVSQNFNLTGNNTTGDDLSVEHSSPSLARGVTDNDRMSASSANKDSSVPGSPEFSTRKSANE